MGEAELEGEPVLLVEIVKLPDVDTVGHSELVPDTDPVEDTVEQPELVLDTDPVEDTE